MVPLDAGLTPRLSAADKVLGGSVVNGDDDDYVGPLEKSPVQPKKQSDFRTISRHKELTRRLALIFLTVLVFIVLAIGGGLIYDAIHRGGNEQEFGMAREFLEITFSPLVALLGTAVAYYTSSRD